MAGRIGKAPLEDQFLQDRLIVGIVSGQVGIPGYEKRIPARKLGQPADVAACVVFLASNAAGYITGHTLAVDGGMTG